jgi:hypothetical protein
MQVFVPPRKIPPYQERPTQTWRLIAERTSALILEKYEDRLVQSQNWFDGGKSHLPQLLPVPRALLEAEYRGHLPEDTEHSHREWPRISVKSIDGIVKRVGYAVRQAATMSSS